MQHDPLADIAAGIAAHSGYETALARYIDRKLDRRRQLGFQNHAISSLRASHVMAFVMLLHAEHKAGLSEHGATLSALLAACERRNVCGSRALRTILTLGTVAGFLQRKRSSADHRIYAFVPTDCLIAEAQETIARTIAVFDILVPGHDFGERPFRDPDFVCHLVTTSLRPYVDLWIAIADHNPLLHELLNQKGGTSGVAAIVRAELGGEKLPSTHKFAQAFKISSTQVRNLIERAAGHGLVNVSPQGHLLDARALVDHYKIYFARELALYARYSLGLGPHFTALSRQVDASA